jgi:hypothetical protein
MTQINGWTGRVVCRPSGPPATPQQQAALPQQQAVLQQQHTVLLQQCRDRNSRRDHNL